MLRRDLEFNLGPMAGWVSARPETRSLGLMFVRRFGGYEFHIGLLILELCVFTTNRSRPGDQHDAAS